MNSNWLHPRFEPEPVLPCTVHLFRAVYVAAGLALAAAEAPGGAGADVGSPGTGSRRPLLGVIRWDMYSGHPTITQKQEFGFLKPPEFHWRCPWFARRTGDPDAPLSFNPEYSRKAIQEVTDQEIVYASGAGIDYWAFGYYGRHKQWGTGDNLEAYLVSPHKRRIGFCVIVECDKVGMNARWEPPRTIYRPDAVLADWRTYVAGIVGLMSEPSHQRVLDRPLIYLYHPGKLGTKLGDGEGGTTALKRAVRLLRAEATAAKLPNPYVAVLLGKLGPVLLMREGIADAVGLYHYRSGGTRDLPGRPYRELWPAIRRNVLDSRLSAAELKVVPPLMSGANWEPRVRGLPQTFPPMYWDEPRPGELAAHVTAGLDYVATHPGRCEANTVLMYAWNEHSEGGFLCPLMGEAPDYKPVTDQLDEVARALREWIPPASPERLPRWRGFNLPQRMNAAASLGSRHNRPFEEETFRFIAKLGFNFARIPTDYRHWIIDEDWHRIDEGHVVLRELDGVVRWGGRHGIHISLAFVFAPGYSVVRRDTEPSLWTDADAQRACARHWAMLARRFRGVPSRRLSFNLWNEPPELEPAVHAAVVGQVVQAIRGEDPDRLVIADGRDVGRTPCPELVELGVAQAFHCYLPARVTHYRASWHKGSDRLPVPKWPRPQANGWLRGPGHPVHGGLPIVVQGDCPGGATLRLRVGDVFEAATLVVEGDGTEIWRRRFATGPAGEGEWQAATYLDRWRGYQCTYDRDYDVPLPTACRGLRLLLDDGNWLQVRRMELVSSEGMTHAIDLDAEWAAAPSRLRYEPDRARGGWITEVVEDRAWLRQQLVPKWKDLEGRGVGVFVEEFGVYSRTPHDVALRWLEDALALWREAGWGWALWNFDGPFGILDSERSDVEYEDWEGHKLDRKMLELLQRY